MRRIVTMRAVRVMLAQAAVLLGLALAVGLSANALRHDGLNLSRNYFVRGAGGPPDKPPAPYHTGPADTADGATGPERSEPAGSDTSAAHQDHAPHRSDTPDEAPPELPIDPALGLRVADADAAWWYFQVMRSTPGWVVFVDARSPEEYAKGHIPGAVLVYHYAVDRYLPDVLPTLRQAGHIVVYCNGGDCEDSAALANVLIFDEGLDYESVCVYEGGIVEWKELGRPVQTGPQP